jgi:competence protein ComEC
MATTVLPILPDWRLVLLGSVLMLLPVGLAERRGVSQALVRLALVSMCLLLGVTWHARHGERLLQHRLPTQLEGVDQWVRGEVISLPEPGERLQQFRFRIESAETGFSRRTVLLSLYDDLPVELGQRWQFLVRLNRPHGHANPGGFDYEAWLFQQKISARGYVRSDPGNRMLAAAGRGVAGFRAMLRQRLLHSPLQLSHQGIILALMLGDRSHIDVRVWDVLTRTGTNHLVVVSGLHVGFVAGLCYGLGFHLWRGLSRVSLRLAAQQAGALLAVAGALGYSLLAGFSLPTQRALVMVTVVSLSRLLQLRTPPSASLLAALTLVLLLDPVAAVNAGFWLSFVAVAALLLVFSQPAQGQSATRLQTWWQNWGSAQWVCFIALLMPLSVFMGQFPLLSPLANLLAIPLVSLLIVPLCLLAGLLLWWVPGLAQWPLQAADGLLKVLWVVLVQLGTQPWLPAPQQVAQLSSVIVVLGGLGCLVWLLPLPRTYQILALPLLLPVLLPRDTAPQEGALELHVLDVGQGLAVVLRSGGKVLVYDTGPRFGGGFDAGDAILLPVLRRLGIRAVDVLVVSHGDNDHAGGAQALLAAMPVGIRYGGEPLPGLPGGLQPCGAGIQWRWDAAVFTFLHPSLPATASGNAVSCVLHVRLGSHQILLPGDIESATEMSLLRNSADFQQADILVAPHHGSRTSSSAAWVRRLAPAHVVFSAGYRNRFGHPAPEVVSRYLLQGSRLYATARDGMISFYLVEGQPLDPPRTYRGGHPRYWY